MSHTLPSTQPRPVHRHPGAEACRPGGIYRRHSHWRAPQTRTVTWSHHPDTSVSHTHREKPLGIGKQIPNPSCGLGERRESTTIEEPLGSISGILQSEPTKIAHPHPQKHNGQQEPGQETRTLTDGAAGHSGSHMCTVAGTVVYHRQVCDADTAPAPMLATHGRAGAHHPTSGHNSTQVCAGSTPHRLGHPPGSHKTQGPSGVTDIPTGSQAGTGTQELGTRKVQSPHQGRPPRTHTHMHTQTRPQA